MGLLKTPKSEAPRVVGYIGKIAVGMISLGLKIAAGSSPAGATKYHQAAHANPSELAAMMPARRETAAAAQLPLGSAAVR